jgi:hypothetical protein
MENMKKPYSLDHIEVAGTWQVLSGATLYLPKVIQSVLSDPNKRLEVLSAVGTLQKPLEELSSLLESKGGKCQIITAEGNGLCYVWSDSFINISFSKKNKSIEIGGYLTDPDLIKMFKEQINKEFVSKTKKNLVFSIIKTQSGLVIKNLGDGSSPLIKDNYHPSVIEDIDHVLASFKKDPPPGRICILNGEPGTGKTHLIRSMFSELDCVFLVMPSNLIASLDGPDFLPLLISVRDEHEKPIIMVIEDGDTCLVPRKNDNISSVTSLLNLSDGILGAILDIKMIISTNADIKDVDRAIMRKGRLCKHIEVGPLPYEQANRVYQRLMKDDSSTLVYSKYYTLAEIYDKFNNRDVILPHTPPQRNVIGFRTSREDAVLNSSDLSTKMIRK